jgi:hypothetical protein
MSATPTDRPKFVTTPSTFLVLEERLRVEQNHRRRDRARWSVRSSGTDAPPTASAACWPNSTDRMHPE